MNAGRTFPSPDGTYTVATSPWEARMSHWVETPHLFVTASGETLLRMQDANWSLDAATWRSPAGLHLRLRKYPGHHWPPVVDCEIDCAARTAAIDGEISSLDDPESRLAARLH